MSEEKQQKYEEYITGSSPMAAVIGRREPYHLTFLREHGMLPSPSDCLASDGKMQRKGVGSDDKDCL